MRIPSGLAEVVALELVTCEGKKVMVPLHRLAQAHETLKQAPAAGHISRIQVACAAHFKVSRKDICSIRRRADIVHARHIAIWLARESTSFSLPVISAHFGGRDHTTALHACRKIDGLLVKDKYVRADVALLTAVIADGMEKTA